MLPPRGDVAPQFRTARPDEQRRDIASTRLATLHGAYFLVTGLWPLIHERSFERVSGPKTDDWLVRTVAVLVSVIGAVLLLAGRRGRIVPELRVLAVGSSAGLGAVSVYYPARGRISRIYWLDALAEAGLIVMWLLAGVSGNGGQSKSDG